MDPIARSLALKAELDALRPLEKDEEQRIMQKFRLDWNYHSNHLEGNSLTFGETKALLLHGITAQGKPLKDHFEITGHNEAINWVLDVVKEERPLTEQFIRQLHTLLLKEPCEVPAITPDGQPTTKRIKVGEYKSSPNHVKTATGEIFRFATPEETPAKMDDLMQWYRSEKDRADVQPILLAAEFHYRFIRIHPFDDGNGRTVRILMNFILMQFGYPPVVVKTEDKANYFAALRQADAGHLTAFVEYIAENLAHSLDIMIRGAKGQDIGEDEDLEKELALLEQRFRASEDYIGAYRSENALKNLRDESVLPFLRQVFKSFGLFSKFYRETNFSFVFTKQKENMPIEDLKDLEKLVLHDRLPSVQFSASFHQLKKLSSQGSSYRSSICIFFKEESYLVFPVFNRATIVQPVYDENLFSFPYSHRLTDSDIKAILKIAVDHHKSFLQSKLD